MKNKVKGLKTRIAKPVYMIERDSGGERAERRVHEKNELNDLKDETENENTAL